MFGIGVVEIIIGGLCLLFFSGIVAGIIVMASKKPHDQ